MLNDHDPDAVEGFLADYVDADHFVSDGREANRAFRSSFFTTFPDTGRLTADIVRDTELNVYPGAPHGLAATHTDTLNDDRLAVAKR
jgi:hypothetical protein